MRENYQAELQFLGMKSSPAFVQQPERQLLCRAILAHAERTAVVGAHALGRGRVAASARRFPSNATTGIGSFSASATSHPHRPGSNFLDSELWYEYTQFALQRLRRETRKFLGDFLFCTTCKLPCSCRACPQDSLAEFWIVPASYGITFCPVKRLPEDSFENAREPRRGFG